MDNLRTRRIIIVVGAALLLGIIGLFIYFLANPKVPSTQNSDKTVIIDNYADYTEHISSDSFGHLGNYLYEFIKDPKQGVYHSEIVKDSYAYSPKSWFSKFDIKLKDSDIVWKISMQTIKGGEINGDISVTCESASSACISVSEKMNSTEALQDLLPLSSIDYIINKQTDSYDTLSIIYYDNEGTGKTKALEKIKSLGFNPDDYNIEYFYGGH